MGYFSNGSEGMDYEQRYCAKCIHGDGSGAGYCTVWMLHFQRNYEECNKKGSILHVLIPRAPDGLSNEQCAMFIDRRDRHERKNCHFCGSDEKQIVHRDYCIDSVRDSRSGERRPKRE